MLMIINKEKLLGLLREFGGPEAAIIDYERIIEASKNQLAGDVCLSALHSGPACNEAFGQLEEQIMAGLREGGAKLLR